MRFDPEYVQHVLQENFEDAKTFLLEPLLAVHYAHLVMLAEQRIISLQDARAIRDALDGISVADVRAASFDGTCEDLFYYVERLLEHTCGADTAGRLHTARSRNDLAVTMYRLIHRDWLLSVYDATLHLRASLLRLADAHGDTVLVVHTHTQRAQPTTVAHYMLAMVEQLERDAARLDAAFTRTNQNPLGACAITGTGFPIDRYRTSALLGFAAPMVNTYGSIGAADAILEGAGAVAIALVGLGRFVQDMLLWSTGEMGYLRLGDGFVQGSSIMPQKRNPVALEHARALGSKALGLAQAVTTMVHNTPFGDINDTEDDLQPLVHAVYRDAGRAIRLVAAAMSSAQFDAPALEARAADGWSTLTELADALVRDEGLAFRQAHAIAARLVTETAVQPDAPTAQLLAEASESMIGRRIVYSDDAVSQLLSARHFVAVRKTLGGPAPQETSRAARVNHSALHADRARLAEHRSQLATAQEALRTSAQAL